MATVTTSSDRIIITGATGSGDTYANRVELGAELYAAGLVSRYSSAGSYVYELTNTAYKYIEIGNGSTATHIYLGSHFIHWGGVTIPATNDGVNGSGYVVENFRVQNNGYFYIGAKNTSGSNTWYTDNSAILESRNASATDSYNGVWQNIHSIIRANAGSNLYLWGGKVYCSRGRILGPAIESGAYAEIRRVKLGPGLSQTVKNYENDAIIDGTMFEGAGYFSMVTQLVNPIRGVDYSSSMGAYLGTAPGASMTRCVLKDCIFGNVQNVPGAVLQFGDVTVRNNNTNRSEIYNDDPIVKNFGDGQTTVKYVTYQSYEDSYERRSLRLAFSGFFTGLVPSVEIRDKDGGTTYNDGTAMISEACQSDGKLGAAVTTGEPYLWREAGQKLLISKRIHLNTSATTVAATTTNMNPYTAKVIAPFCYKQSLTYSLTEAGLITTQPLVEDIYVATGQTRNSTTWTTISGYSTKFAINYGSSTFTVTSGTQQEAYDYDHYVNSQLTNIQQTKFFTTTNGTDFTLRTGTTLINFQNLTQGATRIAGGTIRYSTTGTYTPRLGVITVNFSQAGTYNFAGADFGGQVTFTNSSGGNVTVELETGVDYINSGPNITISEPQVYESATISGLTAGTRIQLYDLTSNTQLYNGTPTFPYTWTDPSPYAADREIRLRHTLVSGTTAKEFVEAIIGTVTETSPSISYLANQSDDAVYNANAVNGSTVTGITFTDAATDLVNINISAGSVTWQSIYAAFVYWMFTATGIADDIAYVDAVDPANYRLTSMKIKNTSSPMVPLEITGGYGVDNTTGASIDLVDTTGGTLVFAPDHVVNNIVTVGGANIITGDIDDVTSKVQAGLTAQGYTTARAPKLDNLDATISTRASETNATANKNAVLVAVGNVEGGASVAEIEASTVLAKKADITALNDISVSDVVSGMQAVANDFKADVSGLATESNATANAIAIISAIPEPQTPPTAVQIADEVVTRDIAKESTASSNKADVIAKIDTIPTPDVPTSEEIADEVMTRDILTETNFKSLR